MTRISIAVLVCSWLLSSQVQAQFWKRKANDELRSQTERELLEEQAILTRSNNPDNPDDLGSVEGLAYKGKKPPRIDFEKKKVEEVKRKKKKKKKRVYMHQKTRRGWTRTGEGKRMVIETFMYLPRFEEPDPYVKDIYWYSISKKKIFNTRNIKDKKDAKLLHGLYKREQGKGLLKTVVEEGYYYKGTKHGRWVSHDANDILKDKVYYHKGQFQESEVTHWDVERTRIKEVIPIVYGRKTGDYFRFYESGNLAEMGRFEEDKRIGKWYEYHDIKNRRKKEIRYPDTPYESEEPYVLKEWDEKGLVTAEQKEKEKDLGNKPRPGAPRRRF